jgi:hypothetical protein
MARASAGPDLDRTAVGIDLTGGVLGAMHGRPVRHHGYTFAARDVRTLAERQQPVGRWYRIAVVALPVQVLVLEEQHRILVPERGSEQTDSVAGARREGDEPAGHVGEDRLAALRVPDRPTGEITADRAGPSDS